jgi:hypothetical protein
MKIDELLEHELNEWLPSPGQVASGLTKGAKLAGRGAKWIAKKSGIESAMTDAERDAYRTAKHTKKMRGVEYDTAKVRLELLKQSLSKARAGIKTIGSLAKVFMAADLLYQVGAAINTFMKTYDHILQDPAVTDNYDNYVIAVNAAEERLARDVASAFTSIIMSAGLLKVSKWFANKLPLIDIDMKAKTTLVGAFGIIYANHAIFGKESTAGELPELITNLFTSWIVDYTKKQTDVMFDPETSYDVFSAAKKIYDTVSKIATTAGGYISPVAKSVYDTVSNFIPSDKDTDANKSPLRPRPPAKTSQQEPTTGLTPRQQKQSQKQAPQELKWVESIPVVDPASVDWAGARKRALGR